MYTDREKVKWFSQVLLTHKDKSYGTDGYLRISISTNTEDYKYFNPPLFNISINNNYQKTYNLNYHNASDLLRTLELIKQQTNGDKSEIQRKYQKDMMLYILFFVESNNNDSVVDIRLLSNETDFTKIIIPISIFGTFAKCLRYYVDSYFNICTTLLTQSIQSDMFNIVQQLPSLIKGISSQITVQDDVPDSRVPEPEVENVVQAQATIADLDDFLGGEEMDNIVVPELNEEKKKPLVEVDSIFTRFLLKNDLTNLENMMNNHSVNTNPVQSLASEIEKRLSPDIKSGEFTMLPGITESDMKSLSYMTKIYYSISYLTHYTENSPLPSSVPVFKYKPKNMLPENIEIAYDLFLFGLYIKIVRSRLEGKIDDAMENKALFHIQLRCFTDAFAFSFMESEDKNTIQSLIMNRYKYYDSIGVFDSYKNTLDKLKVPAIKEHDITSVVSEVIDKIIGKTPFIDLLHDKSFEANNFRIPSKNNFSLEQITNEIVPLEISEKLGRDISKKEIQDEISAKYPLTDEILNFFLKGKHKVKTEKTNAFSNNLERVSNFYSDEIPPQYKDDFIEEVKKLTTNKFDLSNSKFPLDEFGDNIVRALYLWDPEEDPQISKSYKHYQMKIENELMEKDLILAKVKAEETTKPKSGGEWDFLS
jgi:hypothetical protein